MKKHTGTINSDIFSSILLITVIFIVQVLLPAAVNISAPVNQKLAAQREAVAIEEMQEAADDSILTSVQPNLLLALSAAFTINFIVILAYSHKKKNEDVEMMSGTCSHFEIKKPEIS